MGNAHIKRDEYYELTETDKKQGSTENDNGKKKLGWCMRFISYMSFGPMPIS